MRDIWKQYSIQFKFRGKLCASVPADPELIKRWLENRTPNAFPPGGKTISDIQEEVFDTLAEPQSDDTQKTLLVFQRVNGVLSMRAATVRAHIKDCTRIISSQYVGKIKGEKSFAVRIINGVYHDENEYWLPLRKNDASLIYGPDGIHQKPIHFRLPTGQQLSALKAFEYVEHASLRFTLKVLGNSASLDDLETIFLYGGTHGYGGERGDGEGRYQFTIEEKINA